MGDNIQPTDNQDTHVILDKETLVNAALEMEEAYTLLILKLLDYVTKMEDLSREVHDFLGGSAMDETKQALFKHLFPNGSPLPGEQMDLLMEYWVSRQRK